jgi:hypothetical protein
MEMDIISHFQKRVQKVTGSLGDRGHNAKPIHRVINGTEKIGGDNTHQFSGCR